MRKGSCTGVGRWRKCGWLPDKRQDALLDYGLRIDKKGFPEIRIGGKSLCLGRLGKAYVCRFDRNYGEEFVRGD